MIRLCILFLYVLIYLFLSRRITQNLIDGTAWFYLIVDIETFWWIFFFLS